MGKLDIVSIPSPGYWGINTNNSPSDLDPRFCIKATNLVVDKEGRLTSRKHFRKLTTDPSTLTSTGILKVIYENRRLDGAVDYIGAGGNKIFKGVTTLTEITPTLSPTPTANDWKFASLNGYVCAAQAANEFFVLNSSAGTYSKAALTGFPSIKPNDVEVAYGRAWVCADSTNDYTVWWSDTLTPLVWTGGTAGSLNLMSVMPGFKDKVVAVRAFNGLLVIFCRQSIIIYDGAAVSPAANLQLVEVIRNVGCISRNSIVQVQNDLWFVSENGVQSLGRVIQEKSLPIEQKTHLVAIEFGRQNSVLDAAHMRTIYYPAEHMVLHSNQTYESFWCFNLQHGASPELRAITQWGGNIQVGGLCYDSVNERLLVGGVGGYYHYDGYGAANDKYRVEYFSGWQGMSDPGLKHLKKIIYTMEGGSGQSVLIKWAYDYEWPPHSLTGVLGTKTNAAEYGKGEYGIGEYGLGTVIARVPVNPGLSGRMLQIGMEADIEGQPLALIKSDVYINKGKLT